MRTLIVVVAVLALALAVAVADEINPDPGMTQDASTPAQLAAQAAQAGAETAARTAQEAAKRAELARQILEGRTAVHQDGRVVAQVVTKVTTRTVDRSARAAAARAERKADSALSDRACGGDGRTYQMLKDAGVTAKSYVDARDRLNLQAAVRYTDDEVGKIQRQVNWLKILLFLVFLLAVIACFLPRVRRVIERVAAGSVTTPPPSTPPPPPARTRRSTTTPGVLEVELDDEPRSPSTPPPPPAAGGTAYRFVAVEQSSQMLAIRPTRRDIPPPPPAPRPRVLEVNTNARAVRYQRPAEQRVDGARPR